MEIAKAKKYLDEESVVYKLEIAETPVYLLLCNVHQDFGKEIISGLLEKVSEKLSIIPEDSNGVFKFLDLNERFSNGLHLPTGIYQDTIKEICRDQWKEKYLNLVYSNGEFFIRPIDDLDLEDENMIILGVFLTDKEKLFSIINAESEDELEKDKILFLSEFKEEVTAKVSDLFYYEVEREEDEDEVGDEYYKKVKRMDEVENFDKEFDYIEDEERQNEISKNQKKLKKAKGDYTPDDEDQMNFESSIMREVEKKKKRRRKDVDESEFLDDVTVFMAKMREAIELDKQSYEDNKPALEKLKLLPQIEKFLGNTYFQRLFLQSEGLNLLLEWIRKFPDGTYPALNQISSMLDIIHNLTLTLPYLRSCQIGGHVMELSKTSKVSKQIQKKARELVEKWSRIVWDINTNYSDIDTENRTYESLYRKKRCINEDDSDDESRKENTSASAVKKENPNDIYSHAKIPKKALFDFTHKPVSNVSESKDEIVKHRYNLFDKRSKGGRKKNE